ncbi:hypothetical protein CC1G_02531 [Coprinopsis cinerea okayama7|uniref:CENP-V/GFA domain-containing protein n=1 Tax=Coprinopsis cinerea (strain Okayama-7 / 130 / ATCC MYA-4618 / FGSC 9003) TaxID=240176 RepID=A8NBS1_COPC7|nr:hypothetical protein CC1G_02531 [Coprinopsis cinerea okayama7\|eukprot:XP_001832269.2 hypothetical protein CC1G_02531 [Coprinopsis cinerea okayama7\
MFSRPLTPIPTHDDGRTYIKARCHCGLNTFRAVFQTSSLPISNDLCHCSTCRHSSGQMVVYHVKVEALLCADTDDPFHVEPGPECVGDGDLIAYQTSNDAVRYFCSVCSAHLVFRYLGKPAGGGNEERLEGYSTVAAGALEKVEGIVQPGYHIYVEDTMDGGLADHLRIVDGVSLPRYSHGEGTIELPLGWKHQALPSDRQPTKNDKLRFSCHCRSVQFSVSRPTLLSSFPHAAYPDLLHPHDTTRLAKVRNSEDSKWWLRPSGSPNPTKYLAGHCACEYCRLASGFEFQSWAYIPLANLVDTKGQSFTLFEDEDDDLAKVRAAVNKLGLTSVHIPQDDLESHDRKKLSGLKKYISSPGRYREFCQKCGATVFGWQAGRPDLICVAVALVDEEQDGARAEGWFDWCLDRVGFSEQALGTKSVSGLLAGLRAAKKEKTTPPSPSTTSITTPAIPSKRRIVSDAREKKDPIPTVTVTEDIQIEA